MSPSGLAAILGLASALCFGVGNFAAQRLTARHGWLRALLAVQALSLPLVVGLALAVDGVPVLEARSLLLLLGLGLLNVFGLAAMYRSFAVGALSVVAPIASSFAATTVALSAISGRAPAGSTAIGLAAIVIGVAVVSGAGGSGGGASGGRRAGVLWACVASLSLGTVFFGLGGAASSLGALWPVVALRIVGVTALVGMRRGAGEGEPGFVWPTVITVAVLDTGGMVIYSMGTQHGDVAVVAVLASLFSVVTIALAQLRLRERLARAQWIGVVMVLLGTAWVTYRANAG